MRLTWCHIYLPFCLPLLDLPMQAATYNPAAAVFGYVSSTFQWLDSGVIEMTANIMVGQVIRRAAGVLPMLFPLLRPPLPPAHLPSPRLCRRRSQQSSTARARRSGAHNRWCRICC